MAKPRRVSRKKSVVFTDKQLSDLVERVRADGYLDTKQCAWYANVGVSTLKVWRTAKHKGPPGPPWHWINSKVVYRPSEVNAWMDAQRAVRP
jgi:hypothetical protein